MGSLKISYQQEKVYLDDNHIFFDFGQEKNARQEKKCGDYLSGGALQPNRHGGENYRFAFNGMEQDNEISGQGNHYTTPFRPYNPRLGRWMSTDPVTHPQFSPYSAFDNNPVYWSDPSGADSEKKGEGNDGGNDPVYDQGTLPEVTVVAIGKRIESKGPATIPTGGGTIAENNNYWDEYSRRNVDWQGGSLWNAKRRSSMELGIDPNSTTKNWGEFDRKVEEWKNYYKKYRVVSTWTLEGGSGHFVQERATPLNDISVADADDNWIKTTEPYAEHFNIEMTKWTMISTIVSMNSYAGSGKMPINSTRGSVTFSPFQSGMYKYSSKTIFRAVDDFELTLINQHKRFLTHNNSPGRFFAKSISDANWYGDRIYGVGNYTIIKAKFSGNLNKYWQPHSDIGAYWFPASQLNNLKIK